MIVYGTASITFNMLSTISYNYIILPI